MISPPAIEEAKAEITDCTFHAIEIPIDLQHQSEITGTHFLYSGGVAPLMMGKMKRLTNFFTKSLMLNARAIVLANFIVSTAKTDIQTL
mmetsp:Transcript_4680/g.9249  ORF Transcript_4680/g.9249 Transcript_4680/m.9249 type:complete len:89 (-) Transcript_4680:579-845(-)